MANTRAGGNRYASLFLAVEAGLLVENTGASLVLMRIPRGRCLSFALPVMQMDKRRYVCHTAVRLVRGTRRQPKST
jgi:hypothetical protein